MNSIAGKGVVLMRMSSWWLAAMAVVLVAGCAPAQPDAADNAPTETEGLDLEPIKVYLVENAAEMKTSTAALAQSAQAYYDLAEAASFDYDALWAANGGQVAGLIEEARGHWLDASIAYESSEGLVAGVPSLAYYDVWIDAGPSGEDDPEEALDWQLELPDGRVLDKPGNLFHNLTEPVLWGTVDEYVGLRADLDGDGSIDPTEALPEAAMLLGAAQALDGATEEMSGAIDGWEPTLDDSFTALVVMIPTMNEYFEQWKLSSFVIGDESEEISFVATSRLLDITGILRGLNLTYDTISPTVASADPDLHAQIDQGMDELVTYVDDLYTQEQGGRRFTPDEADLFGTEAQSRAEALVGQISQAVGLLNITIAE
jgi:hypothetical protein